jgi:hypothetical protein
MTFRTPADRRCSRSYCGLPFAEAGVGDWLESRLSDETWLSGVIPMGFEAYARVFHPPYRAVAPGEQPSLFAPTEVRVDAVGEESTVFMREVRWSEVAAANGRVAHPTMEWAAITGDWAYRYGDASQPGIWDREPQRGSLDLRPTIRMCELLALFTTTPGRCYFGISPIYNDLPERVLSDAPAVAGTHVLTGPLFALPDISFEVHWYRSPNLWWPEDRAWCVVSDYDLQETYLAASDDCVDRLLDDAVLEVMRLDPDQPTTDDINPEPRGTYRA